MHKVALIGDSIRMYYEDTVRQGLAGSAEVVSPKQNGGDSANVLANLDSWVISHQPDLVHLNCGLHDIKRVGGQGPQVPLDQYRQNLDQILWRILTETTATVLWATTTPVNQQWHHERKGFDRWESDVAAYNEAALEVVGRHGVAVDNLFSLVMSTGRDSLLSPDGVHFTTDGAVLLGKAVAQAIREHLTRRSAAR